MCKLFFMFLSHLFNNQISRHSGCRMYITCFLSVQWLTWTWRIITIFFFLFQNFYWLIDWFLREREEGREEKRERERNINLLFLLFMHLLADSSMCPEWGWNLNLGQSGWQSNQLSYQAGAHNNFQYIHCNVSLLKFSFSNSGLGFWWQLHS